MKSGFGMNCPIFLKNIVAKLMLASVFLGVQSAVFAEPLWINPEGNSSQTIDKIRSKLLGIGIYPIIVHGWVDSFDFTLPEWIFRQLNNENKADIIIEEFVIK